MKQRIYQLFVAIDIKDLEFLFEKYPSDTTIKVKLSEVAQSWLSDEVERIKAEQAIGSLEQAEKL